MHILEISKSSSFAGHCSSGDQIQIETISLSAKVTLDVNKFQKSILWLIETDTLEQFTVVKCKKKLSILLVSILTPV